MISSVKLIDRLYLDLSLNEQTVASLTAVYSYLFKSTLLADTVCDEFEILADISEGQKFALQEFVKVIHIKLNRIVASSVNKELLVRARDSLKTTLKETYQTQCGLLKTLTN